MKTWIRILSLVATALTLSSMALTSTGFAQTRRSSTSNYSPGTSAYGSSIAYGYSNEFITNFTSGSIVSEKQCNGPGCKTYTGITLQGTYLHTMNSNVQAGAFAKIYKPYDDTLFTLVGLGVYNLTTDFKNSIFFMGGLGIYPVLRSDSSTGSTWENKLGFTLGAGKRFPIWDRINYIPSVSIFKKGDLDFGFDLEFLNFSIMF